MCVNESVRDVPSSTSNSSSGIHSFLSCVLSRLQVPTSTDSFMCYGPVVPDGYGACYNPFPDCIYVCLTSFRDCPDTDSQMFVFSLESSLLQMRELCLQGKQPSGS